jgi:Bacteriophage baseplate protein W
VTTALGREFLGVGWSFPIRVSPSGALTYSSGEEHIQQAIWLVIGTALGERSMRPEFGCGIHEYVFAPNSPTTRGNVAHQVRRALTDWEPRIDVQDVSVEAVPGVENLMLIRVDYRVQATNSFHNLVRPFYLNEGTGA